MKNKCTRALKAAAVILIMALTAGLLGACKAAESEKKVDKTINPLTGVSGTAKSAIGMRPVAIVVENSPDARPQWGMDDEKYPPDMLIQGEVEGGITRTLWLYADWNKLPEQIGPMRSARPPFIKASEWFDSIFIHWGYSHSLGDYIGANSVFYDDKVDHIDGMTYRDTGLYDRDTSRAVSSEHTGIIYGKEVDKAIKTKKFRRGSQAKTKLKWKSKAGKLSDETAGAVHVEYSTRAEGFMDTDWTYNEEDKMYHTANFENDFKRDNLIILHCRTNYITNDKTTYCDYEYTKGGTAQIFSQGTVETCKFSVKDNKFTLYREVENEEGETVKKAVKLNPGKSWVGLISANNGGVVEITPLPEKEDKE